MGNTASEVSLKWRDDPASSAGRALRRLFRELSDEYAALGRPAVHRYGLIALSIVAGTLTVVLASFLGLPWAGFGPSIFLSCTIVFFALGGFGDSNPIAIRTTNWVKVWKFYDIALAVVVTCSVALLVFKLGLLIGIILGAIIGAGVAAIYCLAIAMPIRESRQRVVDKSDEIIERLGSAGISQWAIQSGLPRLMGDAWMPLYERMFGYDEMRNVMLVDCESNQPASLTLRDQLCDLLLAGTLRQFGPIDAIIEFAGSLLRRRKSRNGLTVPASDDCNPTNAEAASSNVPENQMQVEPQVGERFDFPDASEMNMHFSLDTDQLSIGSIEASKMMLSVENDNLTDILPEFLDHAIDAKKNKKRNQIKTMLAEARSGGVASPGSREQEDPREFWIGEQSRLLAGGLLLVAVAVWAAFGGAFSMSRASEISRAVKKVELNWNSISRTAAQVGQTLADVRPVGWPRTINGWAIFPTGVILVLTSFFSGWRLSMFAYPAAIIAAVCVQFNCQITPDIMLWQAGLVFAIAFVGIGIQFRETLFLSER